MKLFKVDMTYERLDDYIGECSDLVVANLIEEAEDKACEDCIENVISCEAYEINKIDGYKIILEKESRELMNDKEKRYKLIKDYIISEFFFWGKSAYNNGSMYDHLCDVNTWSIEKLEEKLKTNIEQQDKVLGEIMMRYIK